MSLRGGIGLPELPLEDGQEFRLGIMGGTFDPIHYGHLVTAEQARESLDLDAVLFMPAGSPAFKLDKPVTPAEDRYAMTVLATAANPAFLASRFEIDRPGVTYTADTLHALRDFYPSQVKLYFITGADAIIDIVTWHDAERIAELACPNQRVGAAVRRALYSDSGAGDQLDEHSQACCPRYERALSYERVRARLHSQTQAICRFGPRRF